MENKSHALAAGVFVLVVSALVVALALWLQRDNGQYNRYELTTRDGVTGLQPQAAVRYKGVAVGKVTYIGFDPETNGNVLIRIAVEEDAPISPTTFATLGYQGVTGLSYVLLDDAGTPQTSLPPGASGLPRLPLHSSPFAQLSEQGPVILGQVQDMTRRVNDLLGDDNQKRFSDALSNIGAAAQSVSTLSKRLDSTISTTLEPALAEMPALAREARGAVKTMKQAGEQVSSVAGEFGKTARRLNAQDGPMERASKGVETFVQATERLSAQTLPALERAADSASSAALQVGRSAASFTDNPQSLLYGNTSSPGPGEPGFVAPVPRKTP